MKKKIPALKKIKSLKRDKNLFSSILFLSLTALWFLHTVSAQAQCTNVTWFTNITCTTNSFITNSSYYTNITCTTNITAQTNLTCCTNTTWDLWKAETNTFDSVGGNHGSVTGTISYTTGVQGKAFNFNGGANYIDFGTTAGNFGLSNFVIDFWMSTTNTVEESILGKRGACGANNMWDIRLLSNGTLSVEIYNDSMGNYSTGFPSVAVINDGYFHEITVTREGTKVTLYIDGELDKQVTTTGVADINNGAHLYVGKSPCLGVDGTGYFKGQLDEIRLGTFCSCTNIILNLWKGENDATDSIGSDNGTAIGTVGYVSGVSGSAFDFDGNTSYVDFGSSAGNFGTNDFEIDFYMGTFSVTEQGLLGKRGACGANNMWDIRLLADGTISAEIYEGSVSAYNVGFPSHATVNDGGIHEITLTRRGQIVSLYIDTVLDTRVITAGIADINNSADVLAGASACIGSDSTEYFVGFLDEIKLVRFCHY